MSFVQGLTTSKKADVAVKADASTVNKSDATAKNDQMSQDELPALRSQYPNVNPQEAIAWNNGRRYSEDGIRQIQAVVGAPQTGVMDELTVYKIAAWQDQQNITVDGEFGSGSATQADIIPDTLGGDWAAAIAYLDNGNGTFTVSGTTYKYGRGDYKHWCAAGAKTLMTKAGYDYISGDAGVMDTKMGSYGYGEIAHISKTEAPSGFADAQDGDVSLVLPKDSGNGGHQHMALFLNGEWVSDTIQAKQWVYSISTENARVYRKGGTQTVKNENNDSDNSSNNAPAGGGTGAAVSSEGASVEQASPATTETVTAQTEDSIPLPDKSKSLADQDETVLMAMNIYAEADCEKNEDSSRAVATVVYNRVKGQGNRYACFGGRSFKEAILSPWQFSWTMSERDVNKAMNVSGETWKTDYRIARETMSGNGLSILMQNPIADHYYNPNICSPAWKNDGKLVTTIKNHTFRAICNLTLDGVETGTQTANNGTGATSSESVSTETDAASGLPLNEEGHPIYYPKGDADTLTRIAWNKSQNYSTAYIKSFQRLIGTDDDGNIGTNTVNAIRHYQELNNLGYKDGEWGKQCADFSGLALENTDNASKTASLPKTDDSAAANADAQNAITGNTTSSDTATLSGTTCTPVYDDVPDGPVMTDKQEYGLPLSKYHVGMSNGSANREEWRLHPTLRSKLADLKTLIANENLGFFVSEGMRSPGRQQTLYNQGRTTAGQKVTNAQAWSSNHNYGCAIDFAPSNNDWNGANWTRLGELAESLGLEWGGRWTNPVDRPHVQLNGLPKASKCKEIYAKSGLDGIWSMF